MKIKFGVGKLDEDKLLKQISYCLEKHTEFVSRKAYPKMWELTDKINSVEKAPKNVLEKRYKINAFLSAFNWILGTLLLATVLFDFKGVSLILVVGIAGFICGCSGLWKHNRKLLGVLSIITGILFCIGAKGNPEELGNFLYFGILLIIIAILSFVIKKSKDPFEKSAYKLIEKRNNIENADGLLETCFFDDYMLLSGGSEEKSDKIKYNQFELVVETEDLFFIVFDEKVVIICKKDIIDGEIQELSRFLSENTNYINGNIQNQP